MKKITILITVIIFTPSVFASVKGNVDTKWQKKCDKSGACKIYKKLLHKEKVVSSLMIYKVSGKDVLEYRTPLGLDLRKPVIIVVDNKYKKPTTLITCKSDGCVGFLELKKEDIDAFKSGKILQVAMFAHSQKKYLGHNHTLSGFTKAYRSFNK